MSPDQVERVAKAFHAAEYSSSWDDAPENVQERFRVMAGMAITLLHEQTSHRRASFVLANAPSSRVGPLLGSNPILLP